jgi:hypothetical protein
MASMPSKVQIMKFFTNFALSHSKTPPNTTSLVSIVAPCANWTLMGLATFVTTHSSHTTVLGLTNECVILESKRHNNPLIPTLNLNKIKSRPNLATLAFAIIPIVPNCVLPFCCP